MSTADILLVAAAAISASVAFFAFRLSARAAHAQSTAVSKGVDAEAYSRAKELYESQIQVLQEETRRLETQVSELRAEVARMHEETGRLQAEVGRVRLQAGRLRDEVSRLRTSNEALRRELATFQEGIS